MRKHSQRGTVLVYALIVIAAGAVLLTGWIHVLAARAQFTEQMSAAMTRRATLANSKLFASQYLLQYVLSGSYTGAVSASLGDGSASFSLTGPASGQPAWVPLESVGVSAAVNSFSPGAGGGYTVDFAATLSDGTNDIPWNFQARTRSPIYAHDLMTSQRPTVNASSQIIITSGLRISENTVIWRPNSPNAFSLTTLTYQTPTTFPSVSLLNNSGQATVMSNFAFLPVTSGSGYDGSISVVNPTVTTAPNSLVYRALSASHIQVDGRADSDETGVTSDGEGLITIDLLEPGLNVVYIVGGASTIRLQGQSSAAELTQADDRPSILIVYLQDVSAGYDLSRIELTGQNNRRIYLAMKKNTGTAVTVASLTAGNPLFWRLGGVFENMPLAFSLAGGSLELRGGLRSDQSISVTGGTIAVTRETDPKMLERYADRLAWLENYRE